MLGFSLPILASFFRVAETKTMFGWRFGPPLAMALQSKPDASKKCMLHDALYSTNKYW